MSTSSIPGYRSPKNMNRVGTSIFNAPYNVQEKIDGSQISFMVTDGVLHIKGKHAVIDPDAPEKLFAPAAARIKELFLLGQLAPGVIYRGESVAALRHNVLAYKRMPKHGLVIYDIEYRNEYLDQHNINDICHELDLEPVQSFGEFEGPPDFDAFLKHESMLGGPIEGVVFKSISDASLEPVKYVSPQFKEVATGVHGDDGQAARLKGRMEIEAMARMFKTDARWNKAIQHLREDGKLTETPKDIGPLVREIQADVLREEGELISGLLLQHFWPVFEKEIVRDFHIYYKEKLARGFDNPMESDVPSLTTEVLAEWRNKNNG